MNRLFLCLNLFLLPAINCDAARTTNAPEPIIKEGKVWEYSYANGLHNESHRNKLTAGADTVIAGERYTIMHVEAMTYVYGSDALKSTRTWRILATESDGKVSYSEKAPEEFNPGSDTMYPCVDMSLGKGDNYRQWSGCMESDNLETISFEQLMTLHGHQRKVIAGQTGWQNQFYWVEGVGPTADTGWICPLMRTEMSDGHSVGYLDRCTDNGELIFSREAFNALASVPTLEADHARASETIHDIHGREVKSPRSGEIYIVGGRKVRWP